MAEVLNFSGVAEPKPEVFLRVAGVYKGCKVKDFEFKVPETKKRKKAGSTEEEEYILSASCVITFVVPTPAGDAIIKDYLYEPDTDTSTYKYFDKLFDKGVAIRDFLPQEQFLFNYQKIRMYLTQLGMSMGASFVDISSMFSTCETDFMSIITRFKEKVFTPKAATGLLDMKVLWNNSKNKQTSYLGIPKPRFPNSITFWATTVFKDDKGVVTYGNSAIQLNAYEMKTCMKPEYSNNNDKPTGDGTIQNGSGGLAESMAAAPGSAAGFSFQAPPVDSNDLF